MQWGNSDQTRSRGECAGRDSIHLRGDSKNENEGASSLRWGLQNPRRAHGEGGRRHKGRHPGAVGEVERASFIDLTASKAKGAGEIKGRN